VQAEVMALWDSLGQFRDEAQQREAATLAVRAELEKERAATTAALQGEISTVHGRLAQAEGEARERAATTAALQTEIATLRGRLAEAEGEARQRAATTAALQAEIEMLQGRLTAARQVGKAAIAAFRTETVAPTKPLVPRGWRRAAIRLLDADTSF
jgi:chromosome segregation ATPase